MEVEYHPRERRGLRVMWCPKLKSYPDPADAQGFRRTAMELIVLKVGDVNTSQFELWLMERLEAELERTVLNTHALVKHGILKFR